MSQISSGRGIILSLAASVMFAGLSGYVTLLSPLNGNDLFAWRILWTFLGILFFVAQPKHRISLREFAARLRIEPRLWLMLPVSAGLIGMQMWLFTWAPLHGRATDVSLGYFVLPLAMVFTGRVVYRERLNLLQWLAVGFAACGVLHEFLIAQAFSWPTLLVALGYPPYFMLRRKINLEPLIVFIAELTCILPLALVFLYFSNPPLGVLLAEPRFWLLLPGLGILSAVAQSCYLLSSRLLPMAVFGLLGYVEPVLLLVVALLFLDEPFSSGRLWTYGPIWIAVALMAFHGAVVWRNKTAELRA